MPPKLYLVHSRKEVPEDGFVATQMLQRPGAHALGTRIPGSMVEHDAVVALIGLLLQTFKKTGNEVRMKFAKNDDLVICIWISAEHGKSMVEKYAKDFKEILQKQGLVANPIMCHLRAPVDKTLH